MTNLCIPEPPRDLILKAVIICDDIAFAARANATLRRVGYQADVNAQWITKYWPVNALNDTVLAEKALAETLDAHLIVIPSHSAQSIPSFVLDWLGRWALLRQIQTAALGVIRYGRSADLTTSVASELSTFVRQHDLQLLIDEGHAAKGAVKVLIGSSSEGTLPLPIERSHSMGLAMPNSFRAFGINE